MKNKIWTFALGALLLSLSSFARAAPLFTIFGDNYLDLSFSQNSEADIVTVSGPQIRMTFGGDAQTLQVIFIRDQCRSRPDDQTIQTCNSRDIQSAELLNASGGPSSVAVGEVSSLILQTTKTTQLGADPTLDFGTHNFALWLSTSVFADVTLAGSAMLEQ